ncbi:OLC1v1013557C1 [Oldenlandia corymbosa var. corymbosa]|uniref:OLC1v1013557C1 n=1 Tax=Oldenlandia corymbosa var. corymbosa TaxID=529605 RepID=A0AAV1E139_OLDCO|nr:OLC1v1013557C1 [Oldenlandia corymbosa var. corymbosa]
MTPRTGGVSRPDRPRNYQGEGPNWMLIAGGALLSTLSVRLGFKLKQVLDAKPTENVSITSKGAEKFSERKKSGSCAVHSNGYYFHQDGNSCCSCLAGSGNVVDVKQHCDGQMMSKSEMPLPIVTVPASEFSKENGVIWASSPDRLELPQKPFHHSNSSDSPCVSEAGSDIFSNREVLQKMRQQLKRRDEMIIEMQDQIAELQTSLSTQLTHSSHLQALLDAANRDLFDSEREIQRLRKVIADHCVGKDNSTDKASSAPVWPGEVRNGHLHDYPEVDGHLDDSEKERTSDRVEMLRREINDLREVIEGKDYLLQSYKEQKAELSVKIKELQQRLDSQLPNIL